MCTKPVVVNAWLVLGAAVVACGLFANSVVALEREVTVAHPVSTRGLDVSQPAGARELYRRLQNAAWIVCTRANRADLRPQPDPNACAEKSLGQAVRSAHMPLLVQAYLETHTLGQAAANGINVPVQLAAR
jgi:UrcA family protein